MKKLLMLSDSLGVARCFPEETSDDQVWIYRLMDTFAGQCKMRLFRQKSLDARRLHAYYHSNLKAYHDVDIVVIQVGVVDSYPRSLSREDLRWMNKMPQWVQNIVNARVKANTEYFIKRRDNRYVKPHEYRSYMEKMKSFYPHAEFLIVPIGPACTAFIEGNSLVKASIEEYNAILQDIFGEAYLAETYEGVDLDKMFISDGHHLTAAGHEQVFNTLSKQLTKLLAE